MPELRSLRVFLCHASQDKPVVREIFKRLKSENWIDPWLDEEKLLPGMNWDVEIERAVRESDVVIVCLSNNSLNKRGFIQKEIKMALDVADQIPEGQIYIIPLRLEECDVPSRLGKWQWVNFFENRVSAYNLLLSALKSKIVSSPSGVDRNMRIAQLEGELSELRMELTLAYDATIEGWAKALELREGEAFGHSFRVAELTVKFAVELGLSQEEIIDIRRGALLHDVGKIRVSEDVLLKPGKLSEEEWKLMRIHPQYAFEMLSPIKYLQRALEIPYCHHERWDGTGFPQGLKGIEIPLSARIFTIVDTWDALRAERSYRRSWSRAEVLDYLYESSGKNFDPDLVKVFTQLIDKFLPE